MQAPEADDAGPRIAGLTWRRGAAFAEGARGVVALSALERDLLGALVDAAGEPVPRDRLASDGRAADFAVRRLRRKLERDPGDPRILLTVRGVGYRIGVAREAPLPSPPAALVELRDRHVDVGLGVVHRLGRAFPP